MRDKVEEKKSEGRQKEEENTKLSTERTIDGGRATELLMKRGKTIQT